MGPYIFEKLSVATKPSEPAGVPFHIAYEGEQLGDRPGTDRIIDIRY